MIRDIASPDLVRIVPSRYGDILCLSCDHYIGKALIDYGEYSESEVTLWRALLSPDAICVDAGANMGAHTVALASLVPDGMVVAVEPLRFLYHMLCGNLALNGLTNVLAYHAALGAERGTARVPVIDYTKDSTYGGSALGDRDHGLPVPKIPLDAILERVDFIKADVEGMELEVLQGATNLIAESRPVLYVENNFDPDHRDTVSPKQQALIDHIHGLDYDLWWHLAPHYNPNNFFGNPVNTLEWVVSDNMLALPSESEHKIEGLEMIPRRLRSV